MVYGAIMMECALERRPWHIWVLYIAYGLHYGMAYGTAKAMVVDLVSPGLRNTAYGTYNAILGIIDFTASLLAGLLWQGFGPCEHFFIEGGLAFLAL